MKLQNVLRNTYDIRVKTFYVKCSNAFTSMYVCRSSGKFPRIIVHTEKRIFPQFANADFKKARKKRGR